MNEIAEISEAAEIGESAETVKFGLITKISDNASVLEIVAVAKNAHNVQISRNDYIADFDNLSKKAEIA